MRVTMKLLSLGIAALLGCNGTALASDRKEINAPFSTIEDARHYGLIVNKKDFRWLYQKDFIGRIVRKALLARGFDAKTARYLSEDWDAWRYHLETGDKIMTKRPTQMKSADAVVFANRIPDCLANLATSNCTVRYASELGCELEPDQVAMCQRNLSVVKAAFPAYHPEDGISLYPLLACFKEGGKGAEMPVLATAKDFTDINKLKFQAETRANSAAVVAARAQATVPKPRNLPRCKVVWDTHKRVLGPDYITDLQLMLSDAREDIRDLVLDIQRHVRTAQSIHSERRLRATHYGVSIDEEKQVRLRLPPAAELGDTIEDLRVAWIGAHVTGRDEDDTHQTSIDNSPRVIISEISNDAPGSIAGLRKGDLIVRFNDIEINYRAHLYSVISNSWIGVPAEVVVERDGRRLTFNVIPEAMEDAAARGDSLAMRLMGRFYFSELGADAQNNIVAREWFEKAAVKGDARGMIALANLYFGVFDGSSFKGVSRNESLGRQWLHRAVETGHTGAMVDLAARYMRGNGVPVDHEKARDLYESAGRAGNTSGLVGLGIMHFQGVGGPVDAVKARMLWERAADGGNVLAMRNIGVLYERGIGVVPSREFARQWYQRAHEAGDPEAARYLQNLR